MSFASWLSALRQPRHRQIRKAARRATPLSFDLLENRVAPSVTTIAPLPGVNKGLDSGYADPTFFPQGGNLTVGGIPFALTTDPGGFGHTYVIQDPTLMGGSNPPGGTVFHIPVGVAGVKSAYTLINSAYGVLGKNVASVEFVGSNGADYKQNLVEGTNIRDYFYNTYNNVVTPGTPTITFTGGGPGGFQAEVRFDMQSWILPTAFASQVLKEIIFTTYGGNPNGEAFLAGLTVSTTPRPTPTVSFASASQTVAENAHTFSSTVTLSGVSDVDTTIPFTLGGTAISGINYNGVTSSPLVIAAGLTSDTITGTLIDDNTFQSQNQILAIALGTPTNATLGNITTDTITIQESDLPPSVTTIAPLPGVNKGLDSGYADPTFFPQGGNLTVGGIPFALTTDPGGSGHTYVIQDPTLMGGSNPPGGTVFHIPVGVAGVKSAYTLINSAYGVLGKNVASVEFVGSNGADYKQNLVEGTNIRDYFYNTYNNVVTPGTPTITFTGGGPGGFQAEVRFDMQSWILPAAFASQVLKEIIFTTYGGNPNGEAFLAGLTVSTTPRPTPTVSFASASQTVAENAGTFSSSVTLSGVSDVDTTIPFTLGGTASNFVNYNGVTSSPLVIAAGLTSGTITGTLIDDKVFEPQNQTLAIALGAPTNATLGNITTDTITIQESDLPPPIGPTVGIAVKDGYTSIKEPALGTSALYYFTVSLDAVYDKPITVWYSTQDGTATAGEDYVGMNHYQIYFPANAHGATATTPASRTIAVTIKGDAPDGQNPETFSVVLVGAKNATIDPNRQSATATILQPQQVTLPTVSIADFTGAGPIGRSTVFDIPITLSAPSDQPVAIYYRTIEGSARASISFINIPHGQLTIPAGKTSAVIHITILADPLAIPIEQFTIALFDPIGAALGNSKATVTVG